MNLELSELQGDNPMYNWEHQEMLRVLLEEQTTDHQKLEEPHSLKLQSRITHPKDLQGLPLQQIKGSIKTYSSNAMLSSKDTERGRSRKRPSMSTSSQNSFKLLGRIGSAPMQLLNHSLPPLKVMTQNLKWQRED